MVDFIARTACNHANYVFRTGTTWLGPARCHFFSCTVLAHVIGRLEVSPTRPNTALPICQFTRTHAVRGRPRQRRRRPLSHRGACGASGLPVRRKAASTRTRELLVASRCVRGRGRMRDFHETKRLPSHISPPVASNDLLRSAARLLCTQRADTFAEKRKKGPTQPTPCRLTYVLLQRTTSPQRSSECVPRPSRGPTGTVLW